MPEKDFSIEFWARTPAVGIDQADVYSEFLSFAAYTENPGTRELVSIDEAVLIQRYTKELHGSKELGNKDIITAGSISISINSNRKGMGAGYENWIDYNVGWLDAGWHHVSVTWAATTGRVNLYFDGEKAHPFWVCKNGEVRVEDRPGAGVDEVIATGTSRSEAGSLVLGARQTSFGGNFSPQYSFRGDMAQLRIWNKVITQGDVKGNMFKGQLGPSTADLVQEFGFAPESFKPTYIEDQFADKHTNNLYYGTDVPLWVYSTAPLAKPDGSPVARPAPGDAGHALRLNDQQVLINRNFQGFPDKAFTVEFWMLSTDTCNAGVPFSYAVGGYERGDNSVMIGDYNNWVISIMEDEGVVGSQYSGVSSADGRWHHIAVTWESSTGETHLYDNGKLSWKLYRAQGKLIPSGGSLIIGREQDCPGGCFDSAAGAAGDVSVAQEYGAQDFFGLIDELRIWKRVRSAEEIRGAMKSHLAEKSITGDSDKGHAVRFASVSLTSRWHGRVRRRAVHPRTRISSILLTTCARVDSSALQVNPKDKDLVAYYNFDEGAGYKINDLTGRGNDLIVTQRPVWEVVEYFSVCGNGILEGLEECDTGDVAAGRGCDKSCKVMHGWECTSTSPSTCWLRGKEDKRGSGSGEPHGPSGSGWSFLVALLVIVGVIGTGFALHTRRPDIVGDLIERAREGLGGVRYSLLSDGRRGLDMEHVDLAESPAFTAVHSSPTRGGYSRF